MESAAKFVTALGALLGAIAWPAVFVFLALYFRREIKLAFAGLPHFMERLRKMKFAGVEAELDALADRAPDKGEITPEQTRVAAGLAAEAKASGREHLLKELDRLCLQYDTVRLTMSSGHARTQEMTRIIVKMRALAPTAVDNIESYKRAGSAGNRLAAIAMMQMVPAAADIAWLAERFRSEAPFSFYNAALALTIAANNRSGVERDAVIQAAEEALNTVRAFEGTPDQDTIDVLEALIKIGGNAQ